MREMWKRGPGLAWLLALAALTGCSADDGGSGSLRFVVSGEGPAKNGYPFVKNGVELKFAQGWTVRFDHIVVSLGELRVATQDGEVAYEGEQTYLAELTLGDPVVLELDELTARRWDALDLRVLPPGPDAVLVNDVDPDIAARMQQKGLTYYYLGSAERDDLAYTFELELDNPTRNSNCTNGDDDTQGVVVANGTTTSAELTIHLDHLFWDTLGAQQTLLRFDAMAAADAPALGGDGDGVVTFPELSNQRLSDLRGIDGGPLEDDAGPVVYDPGTTPLGEPSLAGFVLASTATQVHLNGLGFCTIEAL